MAGEELLVITALVPVMILLMIGIYARRYKRVGPNEAMVVYGVRRGDVGFVVIGPGGGKFIQPIKESYKIMSLEAIAVDVKASGVITKSGVPLAIDALAAVRISPERTKLNAAAQQLLSKSSDEVKSLACQVFLGHLRAVSSSLDVEQVRGDVETLARMVREAASVDLGAIGLEVVSFVVQGVTDELGYLEALGKRRTQEVKGRAVVAEAVARKMEGDPARARRVFDFLEGVAGLSDAEFDELMRQVAALAQAKK